MGHISFHTGLACTPMCDTSQAQGAACLRPSRCSQAAPQALAHRCQREQQGQRPVQCLRSWFCFL